MNELLRQHSDILCKGAQAVVVDAPTCPGEMVGVGCPSLA